MFTITKPFSASENGHEVIEYQPGKVDHLPPVALAHGLNIGAVVEGEEPGLPATSAEEVNESAADATATQGQPSAAPKPKAKK